MAHFCINERNDGDLTILDVQGRLGIGFSNRSFENTLQRFIGNGQIHIILNFSDVAFIDRAGSRALIKGHQIVTEVGGQLKICSLSAKILELMTLTKLLTVFEIFENENSAIDSFHIRRNRVSEKSRFKVFSINPAGFRFGDTKSIKKLVWDG